MSGTSDQDSRKPRQRHLDLADRSVLVTGLGLAGFAAADALLDVGSRVRVVDRRTGGEVARKATVLDVLGADVRLGAAADDAALDGIDLVVTSPGWRPDSPLLVAAAARGVPVWGEAELAWRLRAPGAAPWLCLTGTNGKTTTVRMLEAMVRAAGLRAVAAGNVGNPLVEAVRHPEPYDVLAVELSSFQLHTTTSMAPLASAVLNVAPDHLDWHGSMAAYAADKGRIYSGTLVACVYNAADPTTERLVREADVVSGCRAVGFTLGVPAVGEVGVVDGILADRAFVAQRQTSAAELATLDDVATASAAASPPASHQVANALAAACLARAAGVPASAVRDGLRGVVPEPHRAAVVLDAAAEGRGVTWVDDSKATNPHAADASLSAHARVVWVAGGLAKGATYDDLVARHAHRLRGVVLIGLDRGPLREALARHAPEVPVVEVEVSQDDLVSSGTDVAAAVMSRAVSAAGRVTRPGDVVLLAPAAASMDQFDSYAARGRAFAAAVRTRAAAGGA